MRGSLLLSARQSGRYCEFGFTPQGQALPDTLMTRSVLRNFHLKRSGDICPVFEPNVFNDDFDGLIVSSTHGSPWRYDSYVPVVFAGNGLKAARIAPAVTPMTSPPPCRPISGSSRLRVPWVQCSRRSRGNTHPRARGLVMVEAGQATDKLVSGRRVDWAISVESREKAVQAIVLVEPFPGTGPQGGGLVFA